MTDSTSRSFASGQAPQAEPSFGLPAWSLPESDPAPEQPAPATAPAAAPAVQPNSDAEQTRIATLALKPLRKLLKSEKQRNVIALTQDESGILLILNNPNNRVTIEDAAYFPFPVSVRDDPTRKLEWVIEALKHFDEDWSKCDVWVAAPPSHSFHYVLDLPKVKDDEMDGVAFLNANKKQALNPAQSVFDYRVSGSWSERLANRVTALALAVDRSEVDRITHAFAAHGIQLAGIVSQQFSVAHFVQARLMPAPWKTFAVLNFTSDASWVSIFSGPHLLLQRKLSCGLVQLTRALEPLAATLSHAGYSEDAVINLDACAVDFSEGSAKSVYTAQQHTATAMLERLIHDSDLTPAEYEGVRSSIMPPLERVVQYVAHIVNLFQRRTYNLTVQGITVVAPHNINLVLRNAISESVGLEAAEFSFQGSSKAQAAATILTLRKGPHIGLLFDGLGLSYTSDLIPNVLACPEDRRREARQVRITHIVLMAISIACALVILLGAMGIYMWMQSEREQTRLQQVIATWPEEATVQLLEREGAANSALRAQLMNLQGHMTFPAVLNELSRIRGQSVHFTRVYRGKRTSVSWSGQRTAARARQAADAARADLVIEVDGYVVGDTLDQEVALSEFITRMRQSRYARNFELVKNTAKNGNRTEFRVTIGENAK